MATAVPVDGITTLAQARTYIASLIETAIEVGGVSRSEAVLAADRAVEATRRSMQTWGASDEDDFAFGLIRLAMNEALTDDEEESA
jgi:hypothetical protein